ncbi:hypothetical protein HPB49_014318 [Dermacentor silvarum]|uniref:Uncharacterized protein n=1 Tax=Dermacentor silvarum TaxID=543639 RepID=A0ACB8CY46_DERSI|nr:hypothetical protein HPB49_014318 [Dermacentor silvarum]
MTHILVKWIEEDKWDVYPIKSLVDPHVGLRLLEDQSAFRELRGTVQNIRWSPSDDPAPAELLYIGEPRHLERKRAKLAAGIPIAGTPPAAVVDEAAASSRVRNYTADLKCPGVPFAENSDNFATQCKFVMNEKLIRGWRKQREQLLARNGRRRAFRGTAIGRHGALKKELRLHVEDNVPGSSDQYVACGSD